MPTKFCGRAVVAASSGYTQVDPIKGTCTVLFSNQTNNTINIVTNAASAAAAATLETAGTYMQMPANTAALYSVDCDPSTTWVKWGGTTVGSNVHAFIIQW